MFNVLLRLNGLLTIDWKCIVRLELDPHTSKAGKGNRFDDLHLNERETMRFTWRSEAKRKSFPSITASQHFPIDQIGLSEMRLPYLENNYD